MYKNTVISIFSQGYAKARLSSLCSLTSLLRAARKLVFLITLLMHFDHTIAAGPESEKNVSTLSFKIEELYSREKLKHLNTYFPENEDLSWEVVFPRNLKKGEAKGILVYISPIDSGAMPPQWQEVIDKERLIWISANASGNKQNSARRVLLGLLAKHIASGYGPIDNSRNYISGFSGGGRVASMMMWEYPDSFDGAIFFSGVNKWKGNGKSFLSKLQKKRLVFLTGSRDFNEKDTKKAFSKYRRKGVTYATYLSILGHTHSLPAAKWFSLSIQYLDCDKEEFDDCIND
ncbi:MAG: hypothetical protein ACI93R_001682 [Flavobacteriales bacterium]|jgi:hypothetical protein